MGTVHCAKTGPIGGLASRRVAPTGSRGHAGFRPVIILVVKLLRFVTFLPRRPPTISGNVAGSYAEYLAAHEIAHQWFYSLVGDDQVHDPWLDEAFATYLPLLYDRLARPALFPSDWLAHVGGGYDQRVAAAGNLPASSGLDDFGPENPYYTIVYRKGAHYLGALDDALGDQAFVQLLRDYVAAYRDKVATTRAFLDLAQQHASQNLNPLGAQYFAYGNLTYPNAPHWTLALPSGPLHGQVQASVSADFPVANLELLLDDRTLYSGPSTGPMLDLGGAPPGEYLLLARLTDDQGALMERGVRVTVQ